MFLTKLSMFKQNRYSFINFNKMGISNGKPKNLYNCKRCGNTIITEDVAEGVTPASLPCSMFNGCEDGRMWSFFYNVPPTLVASHEWYSVGKPELNIRKIETLREDERFAGVTPKKEPTKGVSGATKFHEKFRKSKRNGNK